MTKFAVRDGKTRVIEFDGEMLANVSSRKHDAPRWTELRLYRTRAGVYVLEKIGASVVVHAPSCPDPMGPIPRFQAVHPGKDPFSQEFWICETCGAWAKDEDFTRLEIESSRQWATFTEDPAEIIDALYRRKGGLRNMPRVSMDLLEEASENDQGIANAFASEVLQ